MSYCDDAMRETLRRLAERAAAELEKMFDTGSLRQSVPEGATSARVGFVDESNSPTLDVHGVEDCGRAEVVTFDRSLYRRLLEADDQTARA